MFPSRPDILGHPHLPQSTIFTPRPTANATTTPPSQLPPMLPTLALAALLGLAEAADDPLAPPPLCVALGPADDGLGVKTPPEGTCARHELAALDASCAVLGPAVSTIHRFNNR